MMGSAVWSVTAFQSYPVVPFPLSTRKRHGNKGGVYHNKPHSVLTLAASLSHERVS